MVPHGQKGICGLNAAACAVHRMPRAFHVAAFITEGADLIILILPRIRAAHRALTAYHGISCDKLSAVSARGSENVVAYAGAGINTVMHTHMSRAAACNILCGQARIRDGHGNPVQAALFPLIAVRGKIRLGRHISGDIHAAVFRDRNRRGASRLTSQTIVVGRAHISRAALAADRHMSADRHIAAPDIYGAGGTAR